MCPKHRRALAIFCELLFVAFFAEKAPAAKSLRSNDFLAKPLANGAERRQEIARIPGGRFGGQLLLAKACEATATESLH